MPTLESATALAHNTISAHVHRVQDGVESAWIAHQATTQTVAQQIAAKHISIIVLNNEPDSLASYFAAEHGPSVCGMAFRVKDSQKAYSRALELGAQPIHIETGPMELNLPAIKGIGGAPLYLIDRFGEGSSLYDIDFVYLEGVERNPVGAGLKVIDHLTHNVYRGRMAYWANFYEKLFNFREARYFDIKGEYTGLTSKAMSAPDGMIRIPLNEESSKGAGQIDRKSVV